jgi:hypothetical protein
VESPWDNRTRNVSTSSVPFMALMHKGHRLDATVITAEQALEMATIGGARWIGRNRDLGSLEVGKKADLVVLRMNNFCVTPMHDPVSALVYSALGNEPETVIVHGAVVVSQQAMTTVDESAVRDAAVRSARELTGRAGTDGLARRRWRPRGLVTSGSIRMRPPIGKPVRHLAAGHLGPSQCFWKPSRRVGQAATYGFLDRRPDAAEMLSGGWRLAAGGWRLAAGGRGSGRAAAGMRCGARHGPTRAQVQMEGSRTTRGLTREAVRGISLRWSEGRHDTYAHACGRQGRPPARVSLDARDSR